MTKRGVLKAYALADEAREKAIADLLAFYQHSEADRIRGVLDHEAIIDRLVAAHVAWRAMQARAHDLDPHWRLVRGRCHER